MKSKRLGLALAAATLLLAPLLLTPVGLLQAANVPSWNTSAASNNSAAPDGFPEAMAPSAVNDTAREIMAAVARWYGDTQGSLVLGGTGTAYTLTSNSTYTALTQLPPLVVEVNTDSTGAATLAVDGLAAKDIVLPDGDAIAAGTLKDGAVVVLAYENGADDFVLVAGANLPDTGTASGDVPLLGSSGLDSSIHGSAVPVGTVLDYAGSSAPSGWLILNGDTICAAAASCDQSSDDYEDLFTLLWESVSNDNAPVSGGRGASAAADWAANKTLTLFDARGRATIGSGTGSGLTARTHGDSDGEEEHQLTVDEMPSHGHPGSTVTTTFTDSGNGRVTEGGGGADSTEPLSVASQGGGSAHNNMQPWLALTKIVRY